jgi:hypothetical protein
VGETPHLAARLQALADPDCVLVSEATHRLVGRLFDCDAKGKHALKGFPEPVSVWCVRGESTGESRFAAVRHAHMEFVGRERELETLCAGWKKAQGGTGSAVVVSGEAGIGKSRLVGALQDRIQAGEHSMTIWQCSPYHGNSALYPVIRQLESAAAFSPDDSDARKLEKLEGLLNVGQAGANQSVLLVADLLSLKLEGGYGSLELAPAQRKAALIAAIAGWIATMAEKQPLLLLLEDAHWIDPTTQELMTRLIATVANMAVLIVVTARPNFASPWSGRPHVAALTLDRLTLDESERMVATVVAKRLFDHELVEEIVAKSDGNPLFLEELTRAVLDSAARGGHAVPDTLQDSLMARLDVLGDAKDVAQLASVIGRRFSMALLAALSSRNLLAISADISILIAEELIYPVGRAGDEVYEFKHALLRDAAYEGLLLARRRQIHGRIARVLEERFAAVVETEPELLAHHFAEAGEPGPASGYSERSGDRAAARFAYAEAIASYRAAIAQNALLPDTAEHRRRELALLLKLGPALSIMTGPQTDEVRQIYTRGAELARLFDDLADQFKAIWGLWFNANIGRDLETARTRAEELVVLGERSKDDGHVLESIHCRWSTAMFRGENPASLADARKGAELYDPQRHHLLGLTFGGHDPGVCAYGVCGTTSCLTGFPDEARGWAGRAVALGDRLGHPHSLAHGLLNAMMTHVSARDIEGVLHLSERMYEVSEKYKFPPQRSVGIFVQGWGLVLSRGVEFGLPQMEAEYPRSMSLGPMPVFYTALFCETLIGAGRAADALVILEKVLQGLKFPTLGFYLPELHRVHGEALAALGPSHAAAAREAFSKALKLARGQSARLFELRALIALLANGVAEDPLSVRTELGDLYAGFTEGFDCPDLVRARDYLGSGKALRN